MQGLIDHYNTIASSRDKYFKGNSYYYSQLFKNYRYFIPSGKKVLEVGCSTGNLLNAVSPSLGVGIDLSGESIKKARAQYPDLKFFEGDIARLQLDEKFDYIILSGLLGELEDIQDFLKNLQRFCSKDTRIIIEYYSYFWQYLLKMAEVLHLKMPQKNQNWLTEGDVINFLDLSGYEFVKRERATLVPFYLPILSFIINRFLAPLPVFNALTLNHFVVARPVFHPVEDDVSVTILIPCRNEKGNIEEAIKRTPSFGKTQEFIFVEGHSRDNTWEEVQRVIHKYPKKNIRAFQQTGKGKGDAVRLGFSRATGDVLMILDADLTVAPEDLPKFYEAVRSNKGEFINGCRLVYPMEKEAMRFLNLIANKFFGVFFSWLLGQRFKDTLCGTKVISRSQYEELARNRSYFGDFDPFGDFDLIFGAVKLNLKVVELPIRYKERVYGTTQIQRFRHGLLLLRMCFFAMQKIKFR